MVQLSSDFSDLTIVTGNALMRVYLVVIWLRALYKYATYHIHERAQS